MVEPSFAGFGLNGYRSYGSDIPERFGPFGRVHLIAGRNNVGKSNALRFFAEFISPVNVGGLPAAWADQENRPRAWASDRMRTFSICLRLTPAVREAFQVRDSEDKPPTELDHMFATEAFSKGDAGHVWLDFDVVQQAVGTQPQLRPSEQQLAAAGQTAFGLQPAVMRRTGGSSSSPSENWATILRQADPWQFVPPATWIDASRALTGGVLQLPDGEPLDAAMRSGQGLLARLGALQSPAASRYEFDRARFQRFRAFVRDVMDSPQLELSVPPEANDLVIEMPNGSFSYSRLGSGVAEVVHIALVATLAQGRMLCIEEPELHLHPTLQRRVVEYMAGLDETQFLVSTHSASMLDSELASISHVTQDSYGWSKVSPVTVRRTRAHLVGDLGNRASELVQSNFIIWVEGPSDRLYINHWLHKMNPQLLEGVHYSTVFYGGALLNHLTAHDDEVTDFIRLAEINRHFAIVIDSDRSSSGAELNATKTRVQQEASAIGSYCWVTDGYTIENYVPVDRLRLAVGQRYPTRDYTITESIWHSPLGQAFDGTTDARPSKVMIARDIIAMHLDRHEWPENLHAHIAAIESAIRKANAL